MADTIPDVIVGNDAYVNLNTATSISVGTAMVISNKSPTEVLLQISPTQPSADSLDGEVLWVGPSNLSTKLITSEETNPVWAISRQHTSARISVQDNS